MPSRRRCIATLAQLMVVPVAVLRAQDQRGGAAQPATVTFTIEGMT